jgi:predicted amidohydrolase
MAALNELWIAGVPMDFAWQDPTENLRRMENWIVATLDENPRISRERLVIQFPELCLTGFVTQNPGDAAFQRNSTEVRAALKLAEKHQVALVFGYPEKVENSKAPRNVLALASSDGNFQAIYHKIHLFTQGAPSESETYQAGQSLAIGEIDGWKLGLSICFDARFAELFRNYALRGVDAVLLSACWVGGPTKREQLQALSAGNAVLSQRAFVAVNRSGRDPHFSYEGEVFGFGPRAEALQTFAPEIENAVAGIHPGQVRTPLVRLERAMSEAGRKLVVRASDRSSFD